MDTAGLMVVFAKVVENGSFSAAARVLGRTPSSVSRQIGQLEDRMHSRLLHRTKDGILVAEDIAAGRLVRLLPDFSQPHADIAVIYAQKRNLAPKIRVFVDFLASLLAS
jgi:DNA-binding transcriptional LysR family regulator